MLNRLLESVYRAFNKDHLGGVALRLYHSDSIAWRVAGRKLLLGTEVAGLLHEIDLTQHTIAGLDQALEDTGGGYVLSWFDPDVANLSAAALVAGEGVASQSNGDAVWCYRSLLWAILDSISLELEGARDQIPEALKQISMTESESVYLDLWGYYFDVPRLSGMNDADYREWIVKEVTRLRLSPGAIELAVLEHTGFDVQILEPWQYIATWDESTYDGDHRYLDGNLIDYHVIQPRALEPTDWSKVLPVIHRNRSAGVLVLEPENVLGFLYDFSEDTPQNTHGLITRHIGSKAFYIDSILWDDAQYDEDASIINYGMALEYERKWPMSLPSAYEPQLVLFDASRDYRFYPSLTVYARSSWSSVDQSWGSLGGSWPGFNHALPGAYSSDP